MGSLSAAGQLKCQYIALSLTVVHPIRKTQPEMSYVVCSGSITGNTTRNSARTGSAQTFTDEKLPVERLGWLSALIKIMPVESEIKGQPPSIVGHRCRETGRPRQGIVAYSDRCKQNSSRLTRKKIRKTRQKDRIAVGLLS